MDPDALALNEAPLPFKIADEPGNAHLLNDDAPAAAVVTETPEDKVEETKVVEEEDKLDADKKYTADEVNKIVATRLSRLKESSVKAEAEKITKDAINSAEEIKTELAELKRSNECHTLSNETGIKYELLAGCGLSGQALKDYSELLKSSNQGDTSKETPEALKKMREKVRADKKVSKSSRIDIGQFYNN